MNLGKLIRLNRLFSHPSRRLCSVAVDHFIGYGLGLPEGLRRLQPTLAAVVAARPDAVTMHKGIATAAWPPYAGQLPMILQSSLVRPDDTAREQVATAEEAVRLGADALAVVAFVRGTTEAAYLRVVADCVREAARFELPVICHIYPRDPGTGKIVFVPEDIAWAVRCAAEMGVDVVKVPYCGQVAAYAQIVGECPVPVVAAGGPQAGSLPEALAMMADVVRSGAGRNDRAEHLGLSADHGRGAGLQGRDPRRRHCRGSNAHGRFEVTQPSRSAVTTITEGPHGWHGNTTDRIRRENAMLKRRLLPGLIVLLGVWLSSGPRPALTAAEPVAGGEVLHNGIVLPQPWPPRRPQLPHDPVTPPYLTAPPAVIPIDVGRQLLVDDFLIADTTLRRTYHQARYFEHNPVFKPDQPWETKTPPNPCAMVFSDGVWYDPQDKLFKLWYMAAYVGGTGYATSTDGIHWVKPKLDVVPDTNLVQQGWRDSSTVWLDHTATDPQQRFKLAYWASGSLLLSTSPDGIHWSAPVRSGPAGDRTTFSYDPFRQRWVFGIRGGAAGLGRVRQYVEAQDFLQGAHWQAGEPVWWVGADSADPRRDDLKTAPQLYNLDCVAYESLHVGLFSIWRGQPKDRPKPNEICVGFSRDGFHWHRPDHRPFIPVSEQHGDWNWGNVQSAGGCCLVVGDRLYFYVSGRAGVRGTTQSGVCTTGLALLRRDGFASLDAGDDEGTLTTRPVRFQGRHLWVNVAAPEGLLAVEVLDADGRVLEPFRREQCVAVTKDATAAPVTWRGVGDLSSLAGQSVRFRFHLRRGRLFAFWVSPDASGASHGFVAAGGPGFDGPRDTVGVR